MNRRKAMLIIFILAVLLTGCSRHDYKLAKVGRFTIYKSQFTRVFPGVKGETDFDRFKEKADINFENILRQYAVLMNSVDSARTGEVEKMAERTMTRYLTDGVYNALVTDKIHVPEHEVFEYFKRLNTTVWAQHILVDVEDKELADSIYNVLHRKPSLFGELASEYSIDTNNKDNEGRLKPFSGDKFVKPFEDAAMTQPIGIIGRPVESPFGYHIIRVNRREYKSLDAWDKQKNMLTRQLEAKKKRELEEWSIEYLEGIAQYNPMEKNIEEFMNYLSGTGMRQPDLDKIDDKQRNTVLVRSIFGDWTIDSILKYNDKYQFGAIPMKEAKNMKGLAQRMVFFMSIYNRGRRMGIHLNDEFKKEIELRAAIFSEQELAKNIRQSVEASDSILKSFYENNIDLFMQEGRAGFYVISNPDKERFDMVMDSLDISGKSFRDFARLYSTQKPKEFAKPDYTVKTSDDTTGYYDKAVETGVGNVSDVFKNSRGYNVIKVVMLDEPEPMPFEENKNKVKTEYIRHTIDKRMDEILAEYEEEGKVKSMKRTMRRFS
ncbi:MAG: peptidylprolyl isomerase [candidate division WOR-3 bacterium]|nr:peptidylprolyl isomerase [candidate division WOR-3 bacterium]